MRNTLSLLLVFLFLSVISHAQYFIIPLGNFQRAEDIESAKLAIDRDDVDGNPMLMDDWGNGVVKLKSGRAFKDMILKFNLNRNVLYFQRLGVNYEFPEPVLECELNYLDNGTIKKMFLRSGYPATGEKDSNALYQVLADGSNVHLLKFVTKKIAELKTFGTIPTKYYETYESYYLYDKNSGSIKSIRTDKSSVINALPDYKNRIDQYLAANKNKLKSENDIIALLEQLNKPS